MEHAFRQVDMEHGSDWDRVARYVAGECADEEALETRRWIEADPTGRELLAHLRTIWAKADVAPAGWDADQAWQSVEQKLEQVRPVPPAPVRPLQMTQLWRERKTNARWGQRLAAAAAVVLIAIGAGLLYSKLGPGSTQPSTAGPAAMRAYVTPAGTRAELNLSDGTHVMLGVASRLRVPSDYGARDRQVYLEGEAYFDVHHDPARAFVVHSSGAVIIDMGTRFGVKAYADDRAVQVVVAEGRVTLQGAPLVQGQLGRAQSGGPVSVKTGVDVDRYLAWTQGRLVFDNTPLREALPQLDRWYDLDFRLGDSTLNGLPVTATFKNQPTREVLDLLALTLGLRQERQGRIVTLYRAPSAR
ncbi:MAG: FecR family protein [Gemmatimonadales bacterium]